MNDNEDTAAEALNERFHEAMAAEQEASTLHDQVKSTAKDLSDDFDDAVKLAKEAMELLASAHSVEEVTDFEAEVANALAKAQALVGFLKLASRDKDLEEDTRKAAKGLISDANDLVKTIKSL